MIREASIEHAGQRLLKSAGFVSEKRGKNGWPDREVYVAPRYHEWIEWKRPGGTLTPAQRVRIPKMRARGELVHVIDNLADLKKLITHWQSITLRWSEGPHHACSFESIPAPAIGG